MSCRSLATVHRSLTTANGDVAQSELEQLNTNQQAVGSNPSVFAKFLNSRIDEKFGTSGI